MFENSTSDGEIETQNVSLDLICGDEQINTTRKMLKLNEKVRLDCV